MLQIQPAPLSLARLAQLDPTVRAHPRPGPIVYYVRNALAGDGSPIKIGTTVDLPLRMERLQRRQPALLAELLAWEPGAERLEAQRHREFRAARLQGEWHWPDVPLLQHVHRLASEASSWQ